MSQRQFQLLRPRYNFRKGVGVPLGTRCSAAAYDMGPRTNLPVSLSRGHIPSPPPPPANGTPCQCRGRRCLAWNLRSWTVQPWCGASKDAVTWGADPVRGPWSNPTQYQGPMMDNPPPLLGHLMGPWRPFANHFLPPYCNVLGEGEIVRQQLGAVASLEAFLRNCVSIAVCTTKILCTCSGIRGPNLEA